MEVEEENLCPDESKDSSLKEKAYRIIREQIINCNLAPGSLINEKELITRLGVSRTPIREAVSRLEQENLVRVVPQRGVFVAELTAKVVGDLCEARELFEPHFARLAAATADAAELSGHEQFLAQVLSFDSDTVLQKDLQFHRFVASHCSNEYFVQLMNNVFAQYERLQILSCRMPDRMLAAAEEHLAIIRALQARDGDKAAEAMSFHLANSRRAAFSKQPRDE
ncbi:MAG: GntR family transcriptional regulator [Negativicutes bacterium]|nr:GntR family transcriptional regulator [Negativicutes bacterium]